MDERLGTRNKDGSVKALPQVDLFGGPFGWPYSTINVGAKHFVIAPAGADPDAVLAALADLKVPEPPSKKGTSSENDSV